MLIDEVKVSIKAGDGGEGIVSFGKGGKSGPDGGNGGAGGNVYLLASSDLTLLNQFRAKTKVSAEDGAAGSKDKKTGKDGEDLILKLPVGTMVQDLETKEKFELDSVGKKIFFCKRGKGGIGNFELRSSRNTTPKHTVPATKGQTRKLKIVLKFIADFGLIGLPSAGKSSLINELTNANVKTAEYHFTTLSPNLGVLPNKKILADIPGLIEGASKGKGLGIKFLKHIQKVSLLLHCISADSLNHKKDYKIIRHELGEYDKKLLKKKEVIIITKQDLLKEREEEKLKSKLKKLGRNIIFTSIYDLDSISKLQKILL